jgi:hypothetical protein
MAIMTYHHDVSTCYPRLHIHFSTLHDFGPRFVFPLFMRIYLILNTSLFLWLIIWLPSYIHFRANS